MEDIEVQEIISNLVKTAYLHKQDKPDLSQELYLYYIQIKDRYKPDLGVPFKAFIIGFLEGHMRNLISKKENNTVNTTSVCNLEDSDILPDNRESELDIFTQDYIPQLSRGLKSLSIYEYELIYLRYYKDKTYYDLAKAAGLSLEGIRKRILKIERKIRWAGRDNQAERNEK